MEDGGWDFDSVLGEVGAGREMRRPAPLYTKLEPEVVEQEVTRLGAATG